MAAVRGAPAHPVLLKLEVDFGQPCVMDTLAAGFSNTLHI